MDLTPPWEQGPAASGGSGGSGDVDPPSSRADANTPAVTGGAGGATSDPAATGGDARSSSGPTAIDGRGAGGAPGPIDSPSGSDGPGAGDEPIDSGAGGPAGDSGIDAPLGGAGGSTPDSAIDTATLDARAPVGSGGRGGASGSGSGGSRSDGSDSEGPGSRGGSGGSGVGSGGAGSGGATVSTSGLQIDYSCDQTSGSTLTDSSGNDRNATLVTGTGGTAGYSFATGKVNNALRLAKASQGHATIPSTGLGTATEMTVAAWVYLNSSVEWQRVWDFGDSTTSYMFLSPKSSVTKFIRFAITTGGLSGEQGLDGTSELAIGAWHHVAVVLGGGSGILYVDGQPMVSKTDLTVRPADLGTTTNNYLGKSQYADTTAHDPYLDGALDEFRVYSRALTPAEIGILAGK